LRPFDQAYEFEKDCNHVLKFTIPKRSVARVLGKSGASINEIKDNTGAQIDVDKDGERGEVASVTVRGTKDAIAAAKATILTIAEQVKEETTVVLSIENKYHRTIIGAGGHGLRELITSCGGPTDSKQQGGLIRL
jgi:polyribonucleotide nucleotidyltransferase